MARKLQFNRIWLAASLLGSALVLAGACSSQKGATQQQLAAAQTKMPAGAEVYKAACAECHGANGEGGPGAPGLMGPNDLPVKVREKKQKLDFSDPAMREKAQREAAAGGPKELRMRFNTAADIYKYAEQEHGPLSTGQISEEEWWSVLSFVLAVKGWSVPDGGLNAGNAASVPNNL
jgi:mono/diheme cytochrome c family protein